MKKPKMLKVFYNGEFLRNVYPHCTKWELFKYRFAKFMRKVVIASFLIGCIYGSFQLGRITTNPIYVKAEDKSSEMFADKIEGLKNDVIAKLASCESAGYKESDGIIILDTNNKASIGQYQWQVKSVQYYSKLSSGVILTPKEAILLALDKEKAGELVKFVAFKTNNKISKDWYNCSKKFNLDGEVELIKKLEK